MPSQKPYDCVVLGAGLAGISAARVYLDVHPKARLAIIERDGTVGGVWSKGRLYPGFRAQASSRLCEFSDLPVSVPPEGEDENGCPDAKYIAEYLEIYLDKHIYEGKPLRDRFHLNSLITNVKKGDDGLWHVRFTQSGEEETEIVSQKLLVATGTTSIPNIPTFKNQDAFQAPIVHSIAFGPNWSTLQDSQIRNVAVLGGGKSAADMVYQLAKAGKSVTWILRLSGKGPGALIMAKAPPGFKHVAELANTRVFYNIFLSGLKKKGWWEWWLWDTWLGRTFQKWFDKLASSTALKAAGFDDREGARDGFKLLKNDATPNFLATTAGMIHQEDFWDTVAKTVDVVRKDIDKVDYHKIVFTDGSSVDADAIMLGTGYVERFPFFSDTDCVALGLPHQRSVEPVSETDQWKQLEAEAEQEILKEYPVLKSPPYVPRCFGDIDLNLTPYRLYRCAGPLNRDPTIAFVGLAIHTNMFESSEILALWATAYLDGSIKLPDQVAMKKNIAYTNAYMRLRIPTYGRMANFYLYDKFASYEKMLDQDLGLKSWHHKGWWAYYMHPTIPTDFKGIKDEYLEKHCSQG